MREIELETMLARYPDLIEPGLTLIDRQHCINRKRIDLIFRDAQGRTLLVEVKVGALCRTDIGQLSEYCHYVSQRDRIRPRGMLVGTRVTGEIRGAAGFNGFECLCLPLGVLEQHARDRGDQEMLAMVQRLPPISAAEEEDVALAARKWPSPSPLRSPRQASFSTAQPTTADAGVKPSIADMLRSVLSDVLVGTVLQGHDIISAVLERFPNQTTKGSILLSDKCYNINNAGLSANHDLRLFECLGPGTYKYLGEGYPYCGKVTWKGETCGLWTNGVLEKWENWPYRR